MLLYLIPFAFFDAWAEIVRGDMIVFIPMLIFAVIMNTILYKKQLNFGFVLLGILMSYFVSLVVSNIAPVTIPERTDGFALKPLTVNLYIFVSSIAFIVIHAISYFVMKVISDTRGKGLYTKK
ncbi:hypothetical protein [Macrococcus animalis]|uniref:hypothetical protein n=1 Tax=Macrococcus animalis TaxID=3395467 RepID=UPI0039BDB29F